MSSYRYTVKSHTMYFCIYSYLCGNYIYTYIYNYIYIYPLATVTVCINKAAIIRHYAIVWQLYMVYHIWHLVVWIALEMYCGSIITEQMNLKTVHCSIEPVLRLTHWGRDKIDAIWQTPFLTAFSWMKMFEFRLKFHWSLFPRIQLTLFQHWFR